MGSKNCQGQNHTYGTTSLCRARLMQFVCRRIAPFCCLLALLLVLLEARDVLVGEEEAVRGEGGGEGQLDGRFGKGYGRHRGCVSCRFSCGKKCGGVCEYLFGV